MLARRAVWQGLSAISVARQSQYMLLPLTITGGTAGADLQDALRADGVDLARSGDEQKDLENKG